MNIKYDFTGKAAVVTGGARGIGLQITTQFLEAGASVAVWDFAPESLEQAKQALAKYGSKVHFSQVDVSKADSVEAAAQALPFEIDILVNNAGITRDKSFAKMTPEDFQAVINTNLSGVFYCTKSCMPKFKASSNHKRIISISSVVALYGNFGQTNYVAAKAGVIGMTKTWARELTPKGFTANAVAPGFTMTPMVAQMPQDAQDAVAQKIPAKRWGKPEDISNAVLFLSTEEAAYISGTVISVDGALVV